MIKNKTIFQVDAFADEPFKGNPAGVMLIDENFSSDQMQNIASEMNLSETAFIIPDKNSFNIRYFTPEKEVPLCGHATLASAHVIYEIGLSDPNTSIKFVAKGADLEIKKISDWIIMNFPEFPLSKIETPEGFHKAIGFKPIEVYSSLYNWILALAGSEKEIADARPDFEFMKSNGLGHLMITSGSDQKDVDFVVRCFAPILGINEDPVTGSAHCALTPFWSGKTGKTEMNSLQLSKRTGKLKVKQLDGRVEIKGKAITIFEAALKI